MSAVDFIVKYPPLILFIAILLNAAIWWVRGKSVRKAFPERRASYLRIIFWFVGYTALICVFAQLEFFYGSFETVFEVLKTKSFGIYGKVAAVLTLLISPLFGLYIYLFGGADELVAHPGLLSKGTSAVTERNIWLAMPVLIFLSHTLFTFNVSKFFLN